MNIGDIGEVRTVRDVGLVLDECLKPDVEVLPGIYHIEEFYDIIGNESLERYEVEETGRKLYSLIKLALKHVAGEFIYTAPIEIEFGLSFRSASHYLVFNRLFKMQEELAEKLGYED